MCIRAPVACSSSNAPAPATQTEDDGGAPTQEDTCGSSLGEKYKNDRYDDYAREILMDSWRTATKQQYRSYINVWNKSCTQRGVDPLSPHTVDPLSPHIADIVNFLAGYTNVV